MAGTEYKLVVGIDLGTTYSCVAFMNSGEPQVIPNIDGHRTTPSVVALTQEGNWLVGYDALHQAVTNPKGTVSSIKRFIGLKLEDPSVQTDIKLMSYDVEPSESKEIRIRLGTEFKSPEEISAIILQKIKQDVEAKMGEKVSHAVITVPAYFNDSQRQGTKDAGRIAGLEVLRIINEPTAAALAYDLDNKRNQKLVVYDLGGGTFDVTVLELLNGLYRVLSTSGDTHLGGNDFDQAIMEWILARFSSDHGVDLRLDPVALQRLRESSEKAKCDLSTVESVEINLPFIAQGPEGPLHLNCKLSRTEYETLVQPLVDRTIEPCKRALKDAGLPQTEVQEIILVGGMTRMPKVREVVKRFFGKEPNTKIDPDEAVAKGAAIQSGIITGTVRDALLLDVTPLSLGVETLGGTFSVIIPRNTTVPTKQAKMYTTVKDGQASVNVKVLQGESKVTHQNRTLGFFSFTGLPSGIAGSVQIEVTFSIDANGIVHVTAKDVATGKVQQMKVSATSGLTKDEVDRLAQNAKGRVIASIPKIVPLVPDLIKKVIPVVGAFTPPSSNKATDKILVPPPSTDGGTEEFLTGDMIDSLINETDPNRTVP